MVGPSGRSITRSVRTAHANSKTVASAVAAAVFSVLVLVGCAAAHPTATESSVGVIPEDIDVDAYSGVSAVLDRSAQSIVFPIDAYFTDPVEQGRIEQANALLLDACMRTSGRAYPPAESDLTDDAVVPDTAYGIWSAERAARFGYSFDPTADAESDAANDAMIALSAADPDWDPAFLECLDETEQLPGLGRDAGGDSSLAITELPQTIRNNAKLLASRRSEWDGARRAWSDCLEEHGLQLRTGEQSPWSPQVPDDQEAAIRTAVIDVRCKEDTRLVETLSSLEAQYQAAMIDQQRAALDKVAEEEAEIVTRADEIIAKNGRGTDE